MTPLAVKAIPPAPVVREVPLARGSKRTVVYAAGALAVLAVAALAIRSSKSGVAIPSVGVVAPPRVAVDSGRLKDSTATQLASADSARVAQVAPPAVPPTTASSQRTVKRDSSLGAVKRDTSAIATSASTRRGIPVASPIAAKALSPVPTTVVPPTRIDSTPPAPVPGAPPGNRAGRHAWLRATGDSAGEPLPAGSVLATEFREVMGHLSKARRLVRNKQPAKGGAELRTAGEELSIFAADHPGTRETMMLRQQFGNILREALADCQFTRDSSGSPGQRARMCDGLEKAAAANAPWMQGGVAPFGGGRRRNRQPGAPIPGASQ